MKVQLIQNVIANPYDTDREDFVDLCLTKIPFFQEFDKNWLRIMFYQCQHDFVSPDQVLFNAGDLCEDIIFILTGCLDVELTDGENLF